MTMNRHKGQWIFASVVGLLVAFGSYRWITDPAPREERRLEEAAVAAARTQLEEQLSIGTLEVVDPLSPNRRVGRSYVYRSGDGWEVSGFYRRDEDDSWHPYLMQLDQAQKIRQLKVQDGALPVAGDDRPLLEVLH